jgi:hypothetical protein
MAGTTDELLQATQNNGQFRQAMHSKLKQDLLQGNRAKPPWRRGMRFSTKMDLCFYAFLAICLYFALLVEYDIDLLDLVRTPAPMTHEQRMARYEKRQAIK